MCFCTVLRLILHDGAVALRAGFRPRRNLIREVRGVRQGAGQEEPRPHADAVQDGKVQAKKNLGLMQMQYKNVYVAYVSMGANPACTEERRHECRGARREPSAKPNPKGAQAGARR